MQPTITTFFMFEGKAEEAMTFYTSLFSGARILTVERYGEGEMGAEGSVKHATFDLAGQMFMCIDSPAKHAFTFTPSISLFVDCDEPEIDTLFARLSDGGHVLMPLAAYPFSRKFGWVSDRFGVSWQLRVREA